MNSTSRLHRSKSTVPCSFRGRYRCQNGNFIRVPSQKRPPTSPSAVPRASKASTPHLPPQRRNRVCWIFSAKRVLVIFAVGILNHGLAGPSATDTPRADQNESVPGIPLVDGASVGHSEFAPWNTLTGGQSSPVDSIPCEPQEYATRHVHTRLALFVDGGNRWRPRCRLPRKSLTKKRFKGRALIECFEILVRPAWERRRLLLAFLSL